MSAAPITLEYELTQDEMRADFNRHMSRMRSRRWSRTFVACFCLYLAITFWIDGSRWASIFTLLVALQMLFFDRCLIRWATRSMDTSRFIIETDDRGIRVATPYEKTSPTRYWWSRLSGIKQTEFGVELSFDKKDSSAVLVPWKAFADTEQRQHFLDLVEQHLSKARSRAAG